MVASGRQPRALRPHPDLARLLDALERAAASVRLLEAVTPENSETECARLARARRYGARPESAFVYAPRPDAAHLADALSQLAETLDDRAAAALALRARELALEASIVAAVGTPRLRALAQLRYASTPADDARAARWAGLAAGENDDVEEVERVRSDDESNPHSLLASMRAAVGKRRLPARVVPRTGMAARAATGHGVVYVAVGQWLTRREVERTVIHEVEGHVLPGLARATLSAWPRALRPAGDSDLEEGSALAIEAAHGHLDRVRRKELGLRHLAACAAQNGADVHEVADMLEAHGLRSDLAVSLASRTTRGGGLGRERVYIPAYEQARRRMPGTR